MHIVTRLIQLVALSLGVQTVALAGETTASSQLQHWSQLAGSAGVAARGQQFFTQKHGTEWSCASCHGNPPVAQGKHAGTGKILQPLAPAFNPASLTDQAKTDKWFRRNCNDVVKRECTPLEKADVLAFLISLRR